MVARWARLALVVAAGWALIVGLTVALARARPYDAPAMRRLLMPPAGCAAPCWLGLRPGVSTLAVARRALESDPAFSYNDTFARWGRIYWTWAQPPYALEGTILFDRGVVREIVIKILFREVWLLLGEPDGSEYMSEATFDGVEGPSRFPVSHWSYYARYGLAVHTPAGCARFWDKLASVRLTAAGWLAPPATGVLPAYRRQICAEIRALRARYGGTALINW